jgi:outer membrane protein OmpA-like peptidoglycan-associated protein
VRDVPYFPAQNIDPGFVWHNQGTEVLDLRQAFKIEEPVVIPFTVKNVYLGEREYKGKKYEAFSVEYTLSRTMSAGGFEDDPREYMRRLRNPLAARGAREIANISGTSRQILYWDRALGNIAAATDEFTLRFELTDGNVYVFKGSTTGELLEAQIMNKEETARKVAEDLKEAGVEGADVKVVDSGISISLDTIQFEADSAVLLPSEKAKLDKIGAILEKYPDRDIQVAGHTAAAGNPATRQPLSERRADSVAAYFIERRVRPADRIITHGYGSSRPVADNTSEEGRRKNRRVEITILEN